MTSKWNHIIGKALSIYADLERRWPDRPQPVVYCLRHLAETANARGELAEGSNNCGANPLRRAKGFWNASRPPPQREARFAGHASICGN